MGIKVDILELQRKSTLAGSLAIQLNNKVSEINSIYYSLDSQVKARQSIEYSLRSIQQRMQKAQQKMDAMGSFLLVAANKYNNAESVVRARATALGQVSVGSAVGVGAASGAATRNTESKNRDKSNWFKIAVGAAVVGIAVAAAIAFSTTVAGFILMGAAVGATIGAGIGGVIGGVTSKKSGGKFIDGFADGFKWGAIGGAISGGVGATGLGILGTVGAEGTINSAIYAGQTHENGGHITAAGIAASFAVGAAFSAVGAIAAKKIPQVVSNKGKNIKNGDSNTKIRILNAEDDGLKPVNQGTGKTGFKYEHNPSDNPKVFEDAVEDPNAVYGYRPSKTGSVKAFADDDWSDPNLVEYYREKRIEYHKENDANIEFTNIMRSQGKTDEEIARAMVERRNRNRLASYIDEDGKIFDQKKYNQALEHCKSYEYLRDKKGKSDLEIIGSSRKGNAGFDACTGLYDDYYHTYKIDK